METAILIGIAFLFLGAAFAIKGIAKNGSAAAVGCFVIFSCAAAAVMAFITRTAYPSCVCELRLAAELLIGLSVGALWVLRELVRNKNAKNNVQKNRKDDESYRPV